MPLTDAGRNHMLGLMIGEALTAFNNANAHLGVGDSSTAFSAAQTDLQASTNKLRKAMDATYPSRATNVLTARSTFGTSEANFAWQEWGLFNGSSGNVMASRKVESLGTKTSAQSWQLTATITFTTA